MTAHLTSGDAVTVFVDGKVYSTVKGSNTYDKCMELIANSGTPDQFDRLFNVTGVIAAFSDGDLTISHNKVIYKGKPVHHVVADRLLQLVNADQPYKPLANMLLRLMRNPSNRSVETFYNFMTNFGLPITDDGYVVAWKAVRSDYTDKWTGTICNKIGEVVSCNRNEVDDDPRRYCSRGFHAGSLRYSTEIYGSPASGDRVMTVLLDPEHVVCVPYDHGYQKVRTCRYRVIGEVEDPGKVLKNLEAMNPRYTGDYGSVH